MLNQVFPSLRQEMYELANLITDTAQWKTLTVQLFILASDNCEKRGLHYPQCNVTAAHWYASSS